MKKNIILTAILIIAVLILIVLSRQTYITVKGYSSSNNCLNSSLKFAQNNESTIFSIDKITCFSSANAKVETNSNSSFEVSKLYQFTDIAIFLNPVNENLTEKNTLKSVVISDIAYDLKPSVGTPNLYYKNMNDFAKSDFEKENLIKDSITFKTTSDDTLDYSKPILFNNCANPITLCYVNSNIVDTYTISDFLSNISYNGSLLKRCGITLSSISCKLSFTITITNNLDEKYTCPIILNIPLSTESKTIYDGHLIIEDNSAGYKFIKVID